MKDLKVELSDSENFTITIVEIVIFTIVNTITIVNLLNISLHATKIKHGFLKCYETITVLNCILYHFRRFLLVSLLIFHTNSCKITIQMVRESTITIVNRPRLSR